ncbi:4'-phosphopantetheinyl transferase family protein [Hyphomicrobium sp.]|uniref:4'-phosphopantetheinyl transferase family protein n=1 Tax=Hyphomicrobium sp. TaxID=82 RepID=UPI002E37F163|nr:4'-phosphopantetheinyl transferase superfamily protein [Hyphomicrobium sp.]HEX2841877.1 4'-phosphopantetheinyl transferase superfamily protein [Hyphomicrobium sp.]
MTRQKLPDLRARVSTAVVHVRWLAIDDVAEPLWDQLSQLLDDAECARAGRFHFERDKQAYIAAHALARVLLSGQVSRPPNSWRFATNPHGKPVVVPEAGLPQLRFNLSHTRGLVAVALTLENEVGIDVEAVDPKRLSFDLAARTFAPAEVAILRKTPPADLPEALFGFWTLKEAFIKAVGQGLSVPLQAFALTLDPLAIHFSDPIVEDPSRWLLRSYKPTSSHLLALALRHSDPARVFVEMARVTVPDLLALADQLA